jgi:hypothetical protein
METCIISDIIRGEWDVFLGKKMQDTLPSPAYKTSYKFLQATVHWYCGVFTKSAASTMQFNSRRDERNTVCA